MKRITKQSSSGAGRGRLRLTILLATVAAFMLVPAAQAFAAETFTINVQGTGSGTVVAPVEFEEVGGGFGFEELECSGPPAAGTCEQAFEKELASEEVTATADPGSTFAGWTHSASGVFAGNCEGNNTPCEMFASHGSATLTATFNSTAPAGPKLALNIEEGSGTVVSNPAGIECTGSAPHECSTESIAENTEVVLTASPASGYLFKSWKGCDAGKVNGRQCTVKLSAAKTVGAKFVKAPSLTLSKTTGSGPGIVSTSPGGVNCGYTCLSGTAQYKEGSLTIKTKPAKHFHLVEYKEGTGSAASCNGVSTETCTIASFNANGALKAQFAEDAKHTLSYAAEGGGQGSLKTKATGILCGYTCSAGSAEYFATETVEVSVALNKGTSQLTWTTSAGTCTAHALTCTVPMSADHSLVAKFE